MAGWRLALAELRVPPGSRLFAHRMLVALDPEGRAVRQLNGLASWLDASGSWRHKPIGYLSTDRLRGYDTRSHPRTFLPVHGWDRASRSLGPALERGEAALLIGGDQRLTGRDLDALLAPALAAMTRINALSPGPEGGGGLPYPRLGFGPNSNSFASTLIAAMGLDEPQLPACARFLPGHRALLLPAETLAGLRAGRAAGSAAA
jgi:hypothetical protein